MSAASPSATQMNPSQVVPIRLVMTRTDDRQPVSIRSNRNRNAIWYERCIVVVLTLSIVSSILGNRVQPGTTRALGRKAKVTSDDKVSRKQVEVALAKDGTISVTCRFENHVVFCCCD